MSTGPLCLLYLTLQPVRLPYSPSFALLFLKPSSLLLSILPISQSLISPFLPSVIIHCSLHSHKVSMLTQSSSCNVTAEKRLKSMFLLSQKILKMIRFKAISNEIICLVSRRELQNIFQTDYHYVCWGREQWKHIFTYSC